jgi:hypothetical protein
MSREDRVEVTALQRLCSSTRSKIAALGFRTTILRRPQRRPRRQERSARVIGCRCTNRAAGPLQGHSQSDKSLHIRSDHRHRVTSTYMDRERRRTTDRAPCRKGFPDRRPLTRIMSLKTQISCHLATQISDVATCPSVEGRFGSGMWSTWHFTPMRKRYPTRLPASAGSA